MYTQSVLYSQCQFVFLLTLFFECSEWGAVLWIQHPYQIHTSTGKKVWSFLHVWLVTSMYLASTPHSSHRSVHIDIHNRKTPTVSCCSCVSFLLSILFFTFSQTFTIKASELSLSCSILQNVMDVQKHVTESNWRKLEVQFSGSLSICLWFICVLITQHVSWKYIFFLI